MNQRRIVPILAAIILVHTIISLLTWSRPLHVTDFSAYRSFNAGWNIQVGNQVSYYVQLPTYVQNPNHEVISLYRTITDEVDETDSLGFFTAFMNVRVFHNDEIIFRFEPPPNSRSQTPAKAWNFVPMKDVTTGSVLRIEFECSYVSDTLVIPEIRVGSSGDMTISFIIDQIPAILLTFIQFIVVIAIIAYWILGHRERESETQSFVLILIFVGVPLVIWSAIETQIPTLVFGRPVLMNQISFLMLKLLQISILLYVTALYNQEKNKFLRFIIYALMVDLLVTLLLQVLGIADFMQTSYFGTLVAALPSFYFIYITFKLVRDTRYKEKKIRRVAQINAALWSITTIFIIINTIYDYSPNIIDGATYTRIGFTIYVLGTGLLYMSDSLKLIQQGRKAEDILESAETDVLTGLHNRNRFTADMQHIEKNSYPEYGIIMCDLNNLKEVNDKYGHSMGDAYIQTGAQVIRDAFAPYGNAYRIGGDEFTAIVRLLSEDKLDEIRNGIREQKIILGQKEGMISVEMGIAVGYRIFDARKDQNLFDTAQRADEDMYEHKKTMKHRGSEGIEPHVEEGPHF